MTTRLFAPGAVFASQRFTPRLVNPRNSRNLDWLRRVGRLAQLAASITSLVLGLMVLIPVGLAISPLVLAFSRFSWK
jgi:hypothetical protein